MFSFQKKINFNSHCKLIHYLQFELTYTIIDAVFDKLLSTFNITISESFTKFANGFPETPDSCQTNISFKNFRAA